MNRSGSAFCIVMASKNFNIFFPLLRPPMTVYKPGTLKTLSYILYATLLHGQTDGHKIICIHLSKCIGKTLQYVVLLHKI